MKLNDSVRLFAGGTSTVLLGAVLCAGGTAAIFAGISLAPSGTGMVQTAHAQTAKAKKAKKVYKEYLSMKAWYQWKQYSVAPGRQKESSYSFALRDIDGDKSPELIVHNMNTPLASDINSSSPYMAYTYYKGQVTFAGELYDDPGRLYSKGHVLYHRGEYHGDYWGIYYQLKKGQLVERAHWFADDQRLPGTKVIRTGTVKVNGRSVKLYYTGYQINSTGSVYTYKNVSYKKYKSYVAKLKKHSNKTVGFTFHKNTKANRAKYLK